MENTKIENKNNMSVFEKIMNVQKEVGALAKKQDNPFYKSKYFDINQVIDQLTPILVKNKLVVLQPLTNLDNQLAIKTIIVDCETGEKIEEVAPMPTGNDPQKNGSAITYYRRYSLVSAFVLQAEDDDGNKASVESPKNNEDNRPWLEQKGFDYLNTKGTIEEINKAFSERKMKKDYRTKLEERLKTL